ncbi:SDR family NAD(P)-dependent oxidoreductase [Streptomyces sp. XM4011]|uniref:Probable oxidoreductase n=1 Tax=Streptomyces harbinensis TaxID=1176198 RepID=A0A1I6VAA5_9ACTN|nr:MULTISPECIES: SDR family NAD(P)-dependent oxidoreductase [Streptomyces]MCK1815390.1 SDR family NAD(P)-dependent oxidoreductase [Streptomyces sp. XM4011]QKV68815.1 SDR family NAD(P)-dependent oxidoreductase [Streptomyces harbinensis]SFT10562.1 NAD(P)-dependent dehydrogenase, short-chain alcohol dehydrogenase family [Streptomyces harbinensis]
MTTTAQQHIGSGFGAHSTAEDVLRGIDLSGKLAVVTGGYAGLGLETTRALAGAGAHVVVAARRPGTAEKALDGHAEVAELDLADLESIRRFADAFLASDRSADILVNNAGIMACPETRVGPHGWEAQFAINHLGHYALANRLWPALARDGGARVVAVSSAGHMRGGIHWDDVQFTHGYDKWRAYGQAKTANALFALHLDTLGRDAGVRAFSVHPGPIMTTLQRHLTTEEMTELGWIDEHGTVRTDFKTPAQGAATQVWAATSPRLAGEGGAYCVDCDIAGPDAVREWATDPDQAARLWALSAELTGVDAFA